MPEQLTKYPDVTLQVLESAGARCGEGIEPRILTRCPPERFCSAPGGELCVYGLADVGEMTQIAKAELRAAIKADSSGNNAATARDYPSGVEVAILGATLLAGLAIGRTLGRKSREERG